MGLRKDRVPQAEHSSRLASTLYRHLVESNQLMAAGATVIQTDHGRDIAVPKSTAAGTAVITGEGSAIAEADGGFGSTTLSAWKFSRLQQATNELLADSEVDMADYLAFDLGRSLGLAAGSDFLVGTGTNQPTGLTVAAGTGVAGTVASGVDSDEVVDLYFSVSTPYRERGVWIMSAATLGTIRKLKDSDNNYLLGPLGSMGSPTLLGRPIHVDPAMPALGSANASIVFGDPRTYFVRSGAFSIVRSDDYAFNTDMATWRATWRADGDLVDLTSGAISLYVGD